MPKLPGKPEAQDKEMKKVIDKNKKNIYAGY